MCGRFSLTASPNAIAARFEATGSEARMTSRYNVAPTQDVAAVRLSVHEPTREMIFLRWGLVPSWASDPKIGTRHINARAETVAEKPTYRSAFRRHRCLLPADGFYEWHGAARAKRPFHFRLADGGLFAFAALWDQWKGPRGEVIESCTIITTEANALVRPIHDRMPVILPPDDYSRWLDRGVTDPKQLLPFLRPFPEALMSRVEVSDYVNSAAHEGARCVAPEPQADLFGETKS